MSLRVLTLATRNRLRESLDNFYDNSDGAIQATNRNANCRVMPNHYPTPACGEEFIAIYGSTHSPRNKWHQVALEEHFGLTIAVTRRIALVPRDYRGETGYIRDSEEFDLAWKTVEARCREIVGLVDKQYSLLRDAEALFDSEKYGFSEPFVWSGTDPAPTEVDAGHFCAYHVSVDSSHGALPGAPEADPVYGILMHVRFDDCIRLQPSRNYDTE